MEIEREIIKDQKIIVIEEEKSEIEVEKEEKIKKEVEEMRNKRKKLIIEKSIQKVRYEDMVMLMEKGNMVERGRLKEIEESGGSL